MKKNDWVTFKYKGADTNAIVKKVGTDGSVSVAFGWNDGRYFTVKGPQRHFTPTDAPILDGGSGFLTKWSFKGLKTMQGHDGNMMNVTIYKNGKKAFLIIDEGMGGPLSFEWTSKTSMDDIKEFVTDANEMWWKFSNDKVKDEHELVVDWLLNIHEYPSTIETKVAEWDKFTAECAIKYPKAE